MCHRTPSFVPQYTQNFATLEAAPAARGPPRVRSTACIAHIYGKSNLGMPSRDEGGLVFVQWPVVALGVARVAAPLGVALRCLSGQSGAESNKHA